jgi:hypothetical protein
MKKVHALAAIMGVAALGGVAAGCGGDEATTPEATGPKVASVSPLPGSEVSGPITAQVKLDAFTIAAKNVGMPPAAGEGHIHFSMDGGKYDQPKYSGANGDLAVTLGTQGKYSPSVAPEITYTNLPAGEHTLKVFLANNDHSDAGPVAETTFTVK